MKQDRGRVAPKVAPFIDGTSQESDSEAQLDIVNPSNGQPSMSIPIGCDSDVDRAVTSARRAFDSGVWEGTSPSFRKRTLHRLAELIAGNAAELDAMDAAEMGKPIGEPFCSAAAAAGLVHFYAEAIDKSNGDVFASDRNSLAIQRPIPRGVVAAIVPWNFPTFCAALKFGPALAAGNCVILKPSELSSTSAMRLAHLAMEAGLPPGVLNVVPGRGDLVGRALGLHMGVDMVTFTGSTAVGKLMVQFAGQSNLKVIMAECGGKSPQIVFSDARDLDAVSDAIAQRLLTNQGQICSVGSRLLVERSIEERVVERIVARTRQIVVGDALDPKTTFGPVASATQCARIMNYLDVATADGARLVVGGTRMLQETHGYFVAPTVFRGVSPVARIAQEEVFGPVLSVIPFSDEGEAIRIANGTIYGLVAYAWTSDLARALRLSRGIRSSVRINATVPVGEGAGYASSAEPAGQSGFGVEGGLAGMQSYMRRQAVTFSYA